MHIPQPILEGLVTTVDPDGAMHLAPMGPRVSPDGKRLLLRPFPTSHTFQNLKRTREGVLHVTDDVLLMAKAALGEAPAPASRPAEKIHGFVLVDACRFGEFVVRTLDDSGERVHIEAEIIHSGTLRDFWGFNRAKHAVLEAAILSTRLHILPIEEVEADFAKLRVIVEKTGGPSEFEAFDYLRVHLDQVRDDWGRR
ncbi:MAG: DUF447 family protein [Planctomycetes bacterium]|nr:DUF447 family protein [Planctomycetota bacterium]